MYNSISSLLIKFRSLLVVPFFLVVSCEEWTPQADGYYIVDGRRYKVHIMAIYGAAFPSATNNNIQVTLQGAPWYNVSMFVTVPFNTLSAGEYHVSYGYEPKGINAITCRYGRSSEVSAEKNSEGNMTVVVSGNNYVMDFSGKIEGHKVEIHYSGLVSVD